MDEVDGFTVSGGEPFDQPAVLRQLVSQLRRRYCENDRRDLLVYSGYPWSRLMATHSEVLAMLDVVVSEPFVEKQPTGWLRGSRNQRIHMLTELARQRYSRGTTLEQAENHIQIDFDGETLWMIGIPRRGDLATLEDRLKASGLSMESVSWRG